MLDRAVERLEHAAEARSDGLANRGADDREQRIRQRLRVLADRVGNRLFDGGRQRTRQLRIVLAQENSLGQHGADVARHAAGIADPRLEGANLPLFGSDDQRAHSARPRPRGT